MKFEDFFKFIMKNSTTKQLSQIVKEEFEMSKKVNFFLMFFYNNKFIFDVGFGSSS